MKLKKGDFVQVITGKDRGKQGKILSILRDKDKVVVEKVNVVKKHKKSTGNQKDPGGIIEFEAPIHISNVMLVDPEKNKPTRVGFKIVDKKKVRFSKKSGAVLN